jgi:Arc/MetJ family transcription regulator
MTDDKHERGRLAGGAAKKDARQDRLRRALRENLKRRKSQARERGEVSNSGDEGSSRHRGETKPGS